MLKKIMQELLISCVVEGGRRTISGNGSNFIENSVDAFFEKGDKAIDDFFDPLISVGEKIDNFFGW